MANRNTGNRKRAKSMTKSLRIDRRQKTKEEAETRKAREARKARNRRDAQFVVNTRVSYVKRPFAKLSVISAGLTAAAVLLFVLGLTGGIRTQGQAQLNVAAMGFCSLLAGIFAIGYGVKAFSEKEKNYILAKIAIGVSGTLTAVWLVMIIIGLRG